MADNQEKAYVDRLANILTEEEHRKAEKKDLMDEIKGHGLDPNRIKVAASWKIMDETKKAKIRQKEQEVEEARHLADH